MELVDQLLRLIEIESVTGDEAAICDFLQRELSGAADRRVERQGNCLLVHGPRCGDRELVTLFGHLDTVPPAGPNPPRVEGDRVHGRGAADMKSGVALMWRLLTDPVAAPCYDLAYVFYDCEEGPYDRSGLQRLLDSVPWLRESRLAICPEPTANVLELGCMGNLNARVTFGGCAAHSARPWQGDNAIYRSLPLLRDLAALGPSDVDVGGLTYREVLSVTRAEGGVADNVVPDRFTLTLNQRIAPGHTLEWAERQLRNLVGEAQLEVYDVAPSGPVPVDNPVLDRLRERCGLSVAPKQAWTDVARLGKAGIDAVNFGPGDPAQAHQPDESTSIPLLLEGDRLLRRFLTVD